MCRVLTLKQAKNLPWVTAPGINDWTDSIAINKGACSE